MIKLKFNFKRVEFKCKLCKRSDGISLQILSRGLYRKQLFPKFFFFPFSLQHKGCFPQILVMVLLLIVMSLVHLQAMRKYLKIRIKRMLFQSTIVVTNFESLFNAHEMEKKDDKFVDSTIGVHDLLVTM